MMPKITVEPDPGQLHCTAAGALTGLIEEAATAGRDFTLALAGGSTPRGLYRTLAGADFAPRIPWDAVKIFFGDERTVPPDHADSNYRMACEALLNHVPVKAGRVYRMAGEHADPAQAARDYAAVVNREVAKDDEGFPRFDLVLLGLGPDGHIASLFPGTQVLDVDTETAAAVWVPQHNTWRISLTYPVINHARHLWLLATGEAKADIVARILDSASPATYPAQRLAPLGEYCWFLDAAAAARLV